VSSWQNEAMDPAEVAALLTPESLDLLDSLDTPESPPDIVALVSRLRASGHPLERVHAVLNQLRLRARAREKFGQFATRMLVTSEGIEQATRLDVASHHAHRFHRAGITRIADIGCGIGGDCLAFAGIGLDVLAVEYDEATAALATYNVAIFDTVRVEHRDATTRDYSDVDGFWFDPARREGARRSLDPSTWRPALDWVFERAGEKPSGIKLGPGIDHSIIPAGSEAQWVSYRGSVVECVVWTGVLAREGVGRSALVIGPDETREMTSPGPAIDQPVGELQEYLYEPDGAVIRAQLIGDLARELGGRMIDTTIAYITSEERHHTLLAPAFRVRGTFPYTKKALAALVREHELGALEIKKRGVDVDPQRLRETLPLHGSDHATLILTRVAGKKVAILADRV